VLPAGMDIQDHSHPEPEKITEEDPDSIIRQMQE